MIEKLLITSVMVVSTLMLVGCDNDRTSTSTTSSSATNQTPADAQAQLCSSLTAFSTALQPLENIGSGTTIGQITTSLVGLRSAANQVEQSAKDVKDAKATDFQTAVANLEKAIRDVPQSGGVSQAEQSLKDATAGVKTAWTDVETQANCSG
jgi:uncharacterized lipoprotein NlpE involved in copper resistance